LYRAGQFGAADVTAVWFTLAGYSLGLVASTSTRVYQSAFFALRDTATPARIAGVRVLAAIVVGTVLMVQFESITVFGFTVPAGAFAGVWSGGVPLGSVGLALGAAIGAWLEWALLRRRLAQRVGAVGTGAAALARLLVAAGLAAAAARGLLAAVALPSIPAAAASGGVFALVYFASARMLGVAEAEAFGLALLRRLRRR
jgi:putative peptidoglycan lipid II flippase